MHQTTTYPNTYEKIGVIGTAWPISGSLRAKDSSMQSRNGVSGAYLTQKRRYYPTAYLDRTRLN